MTRWERPPAGLEPAATALLGWLADPQAPRLCLVSGAAGCGKSMLLAWLVRHGSRPGTPPERAVHAVVPQAGSSLHGLVWAIADQLGTTARAPGELLDALHRDTRRTVVVVPDVGLGPAARFLQSLVRLPQVRLIVETRTGSAAHEVLAGQGCAELDLGLEQWRDQRRHKEWVADHSVARQVSTVSVDLAEPMDLDDPAAVCAADPWLISAAYEGAADNDHGGLGAAWLRAGQSLCREQPPASRALVLLANLSASADPRLSPELVTLAEGAPWRLDWARTKGDVTPPWPGPVVSLTVGCGPLEGALLVVDPLGTVRALHVQDGSARGRLPPPAGSVTGLAALSDGTVLLLDSAGRVRADETWTVPVHSGIQALLHAGPDEKQNLVKLLNEAKGTALASTVGPETKMVALGDTFGTVRVFGEVSGTAALHEGLVSALAVVSVPTDTGTSAPAVYSGGIDGRIRLWAPGHDPMPEPVAARSCPVVALHVAWRTEGVVLAVAWEDGVVELHCPGRDRHATFRPGSPVRGVAVVSDRSVVIATDEGVIRLTSPTSVGRCEP